MKPGTEVTTFVHVVPWAPPARRLDFETQPSIDMRESRWTSIIKAAGCRCRNVTWFAHSFPNLATLYMTRRNSELGHVNLRLSG